MSLKDRTLFVTGASRGIGRAIALRAARDGANVVIAAKSATPHPKLQGTIFTVAEEVEAAGGKALPLAVDVRDEVRIGEAMKEAATRFGGIDIVVNNASAISLTPTLQTPMKRFDLLFGVNVRGTFATTQAALPYLLASPHARVLVLSPPLNFDPRWFEHHLAYTMSKYGMSMCVIGLSAELAGRVAVNALWPRTIIGTAAIEMLGGAPMLDLSRTPEIVADAAHWILTQPVETNGQFFLDEDVLRDGAGVTDFDRYAHSPGQPLQTDLFL
jgi:citronellol/citronellal dehydrogenase